MANLIFPDSAVTGMEAFDFTTWVTIRRVGMALVCQGNAGQLRDDERINRLVAVGKRSTAGPQYAKDRGFLWSIVH